MIAQSLSNTRLVKIIERLIYNQYAEKLWQILLSQLMGKTKKVILLEALPESKTTHRFF